MPRSPRQVEALLDRVQDTDHSVFPGVLGADSPPSGGDDRLVLLGVGEHAIELIEHLIVGAKGQALSARLQQLWKFTVVLREHEAAAACDIEGTDRHPGVDA